MSQISILYRLQQIDTQLDNSRALLNNVEKELTDNTLIDEAQHTVTLAEQNHQAEEKRQREAENKSYSVRVKIELSESSLYGGKIQNPKELQDLQNEVASLKKQIIILEDNELEAMMAVEEADTKLSQAMASLRDAQAKQVEQMASLKREMTKLQSQIDRLESERRATLPTIPASDLSLYEQLRKNRKGVAVAKISSKACGACGTTLTAALVQSTQTTSQLVRCPTCGRILYPG